MMDIVKRLKEVCDLHSHEKSFPHRLLDEAAGEIERLRAEIEGLEDSEAFALKHGHMEAASVMDGNVTYAEIEPWAEQLANEHGLS